MSRVDVNRLWAQAPRKPKRYTEADLYQWEKDFIPRAHWTRNESGFLAVGCPDTNACERGVEVWVENKIIHGRKVGKVRPSQVAWMTERTQHGGRCFIFAVTPDGRTFYLFDGKYAAEVKALGIDAPALFVRPLPTPSAWERVHHYLFNWQRK